ncbi:MAG: 16S rRNA (uracil(1498)-N(3))-methyltransferase [Anaerolineae bacterium]|nr:16S rRNA (uracil(1498)-N(3))-methyltransferase [Anaerolineae bacterium]
MHRFFLPPDVIREGQVRFPEMTARQILHVLRLRPGDIVAVLDGQGILYRVILKRVDRDAVLGQVTGQEVATGEPKMAVTLYASLIKGERFEWILQKGTELGVLRFVPMVTERTVVRDLTLSTSRQARWRRIVQEAAEQSGRALLPEVETPMTFAAACEQAAMADLSLIAWVEEKRRTLADIWGNRRPATLAILIGPEGGFTPDEVEQACACGIMPFSMGPRVLRAETAAVVAVALAMQQAGELSPT